MVDDCDTHSYEVILTPTGLDLGEAEDTRTFTMNVDADLSAGALREAIEDYINTKEPIDAWAFRNYWDIAHVIRTDASPEQYLREVLMGCSYSQAAFQQGYSTVTIYVHDDERCWTPTTLSVEADVLRDLRNWMEDLTTSDAIDDDRPNREIHDAMVRAVARADPSLATRLAEDSVKLQSDFLRTAMSITGDVIEELASR